jgi:polar amino acid transport system substrate-binding protein
MRSRYALLAIALAAATTISLTGCVDNSTPAPGDTAPAASNAAPGVDAAAAALLPDEIKTAGKLIIGMDPAYAPNEFKDDAGNPVGWDVELADAMAAKLGVKTEYQASSFDKIIPSITGGTYDIGVSSFTDNVEREKAVDFVNYFTAGVQWAQPIGKTVDPANACGLTVSVQATTYEETDELPAKSKKCTDAGKKAINILKFDKQDDATTAVATGRADAMSADSPITLYAISKLKDKIEPAGESFEDAPYGIAVKKNSDLTKALQAALQSMVDDGSYMKILEKWGVENGAIDKITINAASKG